MARNAEATKQRIFEAATAEFAERGLAGARVDSIAKRAGANKQLIYAYFGNKEGLFAAVLGRQLEELGEAIPLDADELTEYAGRVFDFHADDPELIRLLLYEALHHGEGHVANDERRTDYYARKVQAIKEGQRRGTIDASLDARDVMLLVLGLAVWPSAVPQLTRMVEDGDPKSPAARARRRASVVEAVRRIVSP